MRDRKLTLNGIIVILIAFSAIYLFATVYMLRVMDPSVMNDFYPIEGTEYAIRYSTFEPSGIVRGTDANHSELVFEGSYGTDWGAAEEDGILYVNAYRMTSMGLVLCDVAKIDLAAEEEEILFENAILRGRCASGELVLVSGVLLPSNKPSVNALCRLYAMTAPGLDPEGKRADVLYFDPASGDIVYRVENAAAFTKGFDLNFIDKTLEEVQACE